MVNGDKLSLGASDSAAAASAPTLFIASDSLSQTYDAAQRPQAGWGEYLVRYLGEGACAISHDSRFDYPSATRYACRNLSVINASMAARSTKTFIAEGKLSQILQQIRPGDLLLVQFAANDATKARPDRYSTPVDFVKNIDRFVKGACGRGAVPLIVTPVPRYSFDAKGHHVPDFVPYAEAEREYCRQTGTGLIDLAGIGGDHIERMGPGRARALYMKLSAGLWPNYPDGVDDSTHLSELGARIFAKMIAQEVSRLSDMCAFHDVDPSGPLGGIHNLEARPDDGAGTVTLSWKPAAGADCYTVSCFDGKERSEAIALGPRYIDVLAPECSGRIDYEVRAWRGDKKGEAAQVQTECRRMGAAAAPLRVAGFDLFEIDETVADRISFSVRFAALEDAECYRVIARSSRTGQCRVLGEIAPSDAGSLHGYAVSHEPGWNIHIEARTPAGLCMSRERPLPSAPVPEGARPSWEAGF